MHPAPIVRSDGAEFHTSYGVKWQYIYRIPIGPSQPPTSSKVTRITLCHCDVSRDAVAPSLEPVEVVAEDQSEVVPQRPAEQVADGSPSYEPDVDLGAAEVF